MDTALPTSPRTSPISDDAAVLAFVATRDVPCPSCRYNLRALTLPRCPECGEPLRLRVVPQEPRLGPWLAILTPLSLLAGLGCFFIMLLFMSRGRPPASMWFDIIVCVLQIPMVAAVVYFRGWLQRRPSRTLRILAAIAILLVIIVFTRGMMS